MTKTKRVIEREKPVPHLAHLMYVPERGKRWHCARKNCYYIIRNGDMVNRADIMSPSGDFAVVFR
jgi:hypothetical protein